jgi:hypothetical protein
LNHCECDSMRQYIFTPKEREILLTYLEKGIKLDGFRTLLSRMKTNYERLRDEINLMEKILTK